MVRLFHPVAFKQGWSQLCSTLYMRVKTNNSPSTNMSIMRLLTFSAAAILIFFMPNLMYAQKTGSKKEISGSIVEKESGNSIEYATISLYRAIDSALVTGVISDETGFFLLSKVEYDHYYLVISFVGFESKIIPDIILSKEFPSKNLGSVQLFTESTVLQEVSVTSSKSAISTNIDKQVINVASNLTARGGTAVDALKMAPSITIDHEGTVKLRGSTEFMVLINGKPTALKPNEVLKQTSADMIDKIEVITSPSVKYRAEGAAGIINIILKKGAKPGLNGLVNTTLGSNRKYAGSVGLNFNREKFSLFAGAEVRDFTKTAENYYYRDLSRVDEVHHAYLGQDRVMRNNKLDLRLNMSYEPNKQDALAWSFNAGHLTTSADIDALTSGYTNPASQERYMRNTFYFKQKPVFFTNNLNYSHAFTQGASVSLNGFYSYIDYYLQNKQVMALADADHSIIDPEPYQRNVINDNYSNDWKLDLDYVHPLNEQTKLEAGASFQEYTRFLNITFDEFDYQNHSWEHHPLYTNRYDFEEIIYGGYVNLITQFWGMETSLGLRVEYMDRALIQKTLEDGYYFNRLNFFPGISLSKRFNERQSLKLSLSNRINRPDEYMMNPFPEFEDDYFYSEGNPYLIPELSRALEFNYQAIGEKMVFSSSLYYRRTTDKIDQKLSIGAEDKIHTIFHNDVRDKASGIELTGKLSLKNWWTLNTSTNFYDYLIEGNIDDAFFSRRGFTWNAQLINSINIGKTTSFQLTAYYNSRTVRSQGELDPFYFLDAAINQKFIQEKLSLNIQLKDVLQSANYKLRTATGNMDLLGIFNNESPILLLTLSYQLSQFKKLTKDVQTDFDM